MATAAGTDGVAAGLSAEVSGAGVGVGVVPGAEALALAEFVGVGDFVVDALGVGLGDFVVAEGFGDGFGVGLADSVGFAVGFGVGGLASPLGGAAPGGTLPAVSDWYRQPSAFPRCGWEAVAPRLEYFQPE